MAQLVGRLSNSSKEWEAPRIAQGAWDGLMVWIPKVASGCFHVAVNHKSKRCLEIILWRPFVSLQLEGQWIDPKQDQKSSRGASLICHDSYDLCRSWKGKIRPELIRLLHYLNTWNRSKLNEIPFTLVTSSQPWAVIETTLSVMQVKVFSKL